MIDAKSCLVIKSSGLIINIPVDTKLFSSWFAWDATGSISILNPLALLCKDRWCLF